MYTLYNCIETNCRNKYSFESTDLSDAERMTRFNAKASIEAEVAALRA